MSESATQLIQAFTALSPNERHTVLIELARIAEPDDTGVSDDEMTLCGEEIFSMYDAEEAEHGKTESR